MTLEDFKDIDLEGEIKEIDGSFYYLYELPYIGDYPYIRDDEEDQDKLWDVYCSDRNKIMEKYPNVVFKDSWADNDSTGCDIVSILR